MKSTQTVRIRIRRCAVEPSNHRHRDLLRTHASRPRHRRAAKTAMNRWSRLAFWCAVIAMGGGMVLAKAQQSKETALIAGDHPVTVEQVLEKLKAEGWSDVVIARDGRYLKVTGILNGQTGNVAVDSQTGRLKVNANDDEDDD